MGRFQFLFLVAGTAEEDIKSHSEVQGSGVKGLEEAEQVVAGQVKLESFTPQGQYSSQIFYAVIQVGPADGAQDPGGELSGGRKSY